MPVLNCKAIMPPIEDLRKLCRQLYLGKREEQKLLILKQEILEYNDDIKEYGWQNLSKREQNDYNYKKEILEIVLQRRDISSKIHEELNFNYKLPEDYFRDNRIDKKRKKDLLHNSVDHSELKLHKDSNKVLATESQVDDPNSLNLPYSNQYDYVFDESQNINFLSDEELKDEDHVEDISELQEKINREKDRIKSMEETRKSLPVFKYKQTIIDAVSKHQVIIFVGETGSGKTTQLPQYLCEAGLCNNLKNKDKSKYKKIAITQPRRVAATSVAARVADEMGVKLGKEVGYSIRFDDKTCEDTLIKYCTDGMLLREFLTDPELKSYSAIVIDEAHERTVSTDILLGLLKDIMKINKDLKVIISSATVNSKKFSEFFDDAPIFNVPGRRYPVDIYYTEQPESNYIFATITTIFQIHLSQETPGDILVFLTGQEEIEMVEESLNETCEKLEDKIKPLIVAPIYSNMPIEMQSKIFEATPTGSRKVVLATNIAETSITINGIKYVIDPGFVKEKVFNATTGMESLVVVPCSQASAQQRAGRAGRVGAGKCFRLYTKWSFSNELPKQPKPEILRSNLSSVILLLLSLGIYDILNFEFLDKPSTDVLIKSLEILYSLGAMNSAGKLSRIGLLMSEFPLDPMFSKTLITGASLKCLDDVLTIVSMLSETGSLFFRPKNQKERADLAKQNFNKAYRYQGDHFLYLEIYNQWCNSGFSWQWCLDNFLQYKSLGRVKNIRSQLEGLCKRNEYFIKELEKSEDQDLEEITIDLKVQRVVVNIKRSFISGFFLNTCRLTRSGTSYRNIKRKQEVFIHPSSIMFTKKPPEKLVIYNELVLTSKEYMRNVLVLDNLKYLKEYAPHFFTSNELKELS